MQTLNLRLPNRLFIDKSKFPYGFRKSGDFSISEAELLSRYGCTLADLETGVITPQSKDEENFVLFVKGQKEASTSVEKVWAKYVRLARGRRQFFTMHSSASNQDEYSEEFTEDDFDVA